MAEPLYVHAQARNSIIAPYLYLPSFLSFRKLQGFLAHEERNLDEKVLTNSTGWNTWHGPIRQSQGEFPRREASAGFVILYQNTTNVPVWILLIVRIRRHRAASHLLSIPPYFPVLKEKVNYHKKFTLYSMVYATIKRKAVGLKKKEKVPIYILIRLRFWDMCKDARKFNFVTLFYSPALCTLSVSSSEGGRQRYDKNTYKWLRERTNTAQK